MHSWKRFSVWSAGVQTHLDSHQHVHLREPVRTAVLEQSRRLQVPARDFGRDIRYCGDFYGQTGTGEPWPANITVEAFVRIVNGLRPGVTELGCHPGENADFDSVYRVERTEEVRVLCDSAVRRAHGGRRAIGTGFPGRCGSA